MKKLRFLITNLLLILALISMPAWGLTRYVVGDVGTNEADPAVSIGNRGSIEATGRKIVSFYNDKFTNEKAYIDKDGNFNLDGSLSMTGGNITANTITATNERITGISTIETLRVNSLTATTESVTTSNITTGNITTGKITTGNIATANITNETITGVSTIAALVVTTADINGGTIDGSIIGGSTPAAGTFTNISGTNLSITGASTLSGYSVVRRNEILQNDAQLVSADFPNSTTLYGWNFNSVTDTAAESAYAEVSYIGTAKTLTLKAQKLTQSADVLGTAGYYNTMITGGYLQSTDAVFDVANTADTDDFMVGGWVYIPDATPVSDVVFFSNVGATNNGWYSYLTTAGVFTFLINLATDLPTTAITIPSAGWYHMVWAREMGVGTKLYVNGLLVGTGADGTIGTTQSKFQLSGVNGASNLPEAGTRYDECFFKKGVLPTNLGDVVKGIYARSAKKFAVKDANTNVFIPELNVASGVYMPTLTNGANVSSSASYASNWERNGNNITCYLKLAIDIATAATTSAITFTLPIACTTTPTGRGILTSLDSMGYVASNSATTATANFLTGGTTANADYSIIYSYVLN
jgi:hypothetical protein